MPTSHGRPGDWLREERDSAYGRGPRPSPTPQAPDKQQPWADKRDDV